MTLSESELYEAGLAPPPSVRKDVALRLLDSVGVADQDSVYGGLDVWNSSRVDDVLSGKVETIPGEQVFEDLAAKRAARQATPDA